MAKSKPPTPKNDPGLKDQISADAFYFFRMIAVDLMWDSDAWEKHHKETDGPGEWSKTKDHWYKQAYDELYLYLTRMALYYQNNADIERGDRHAIPRKKPEPPPDYVLPPTAKKTTAKKPPKKKRRTSAQIAAQKKEVQAAEDAKKKRRIEGAKKAAKTRARNRAAEKKSDKIADEMQKKWRKDENELKQKKWREEKDKRTKREAKKKKKEAEKKKPAGKEYDRPGEQIALFNPSKLTPAQVKGLADVEKWPGMEVPNEISTATADKLESLGLVESEKETKYGDTEYISRVLYITDAGEKYLYPEGGE